MGNQFPSRHFATARLFGAFFIRAMRAVLVDSWAVRGGGAVLVVEPPIGPLRRSPLLPLVHIPYRHRILPIVLVTVALLAVLAWVSPPGQLEAQVVRYGSISISGANSITVDTTSDYRITTSGIPSSTASYYHVEVTTDGDISEEDDCSTDGYWRFNPGSGNKNRDITVEGCSEGDGTITATLYFTVADLGEVSKVSSSEKDVAVVSTTAPPEPTATPDPIVSISAIDRTIDEGDAARYRVTAIGTLSSDLSVAIQVRGASNFISGTRPTLVTVSSSDNEGSISISTDDDSNDESDGTITVELLDGNDYDLDSSDDSASVTVRDNDLPIPSISISAEPGSVVEGTDAEFTVTASRTLDADLAVRIRVTQEGDYTDETGTTSVTIEDGNRSETFGIDTDRDRNDEEDGKITVTIRSGTGYSIGSPSPVSVKVQDDDLPPPPRNLRVERGSTHGRNAVVVYWDRIGAADGYQVQKRVGTTGSFRNISPLPSETQPRSTTWAARGERLLRRM